MVPLFGGTAGHLLVLCLNELIVNPCLDGNEQTGRKAWWRNAVAGVNREGAIAWWALPRDRLVSRR